MSSTSIIDRDRAAAILHRRHKIGWRQVRDEIQMLGLVDSVWECMIQVTRRFISPENFKLRPRKEGIIS